MTIEFDRLDRYAELAVRVGTNLQEGQTLFLTAHLEHAPLARAIVRQAYKAGAAYVDMRYSNGFAVGWNGGAERRNGERSNDDFAAGA